MYKCCLTYWGSSLWCRPHPRSCAGLPGRRLLCSPGRGPRSLRLWGGSWSRPGGPGSPGWRRGRGRRWWSWGWCLQPGEGSLSSPCHCCYPWTGSLYLPPPLPAPKKINIISNKDHLRTKNVLNDYCIIHNRILSQNFTNIFDSNFIFSLENKSNLPQ